MAWRSLLKPAVAALLPQLRRTPAASAAATAVLAAPLWATASAMARGMSSAWSSTTTTHQCGGGSVVVQNPPPGMAPLPEDAPRQTPPRLGEPDPAGPPMPTSSGDKMGGETAEEGGAPTGMPDTAPPPEVPVPPVSPDGSNV